MSAWTYPPPVRLVHRSLSSKKWACCSLFAPCVPLAGVGACKAWCVCVLWVGLCVFAVVIRVCTRLCVGVSGAPLAGIVVGVFRVVVCERGVGGGAKGSKEHRRVPYPLFYPPPPCLWCGCGGFLLSHTLSGAVPSALLGLASGFGMLPGVSPIL